MTVTTLLVQLIVILASARLLGWLLRRLGQPSVVGEMAAGIALGPMVLGQLSPALHERIFPPGMLSGLSALATLGLVLFMFVIGLELRTPRGARAQVIAAGCVGTLGVAVPMALAMAVSPLLYPILAPPGTEYWPFSLFMAVALSITALPVMARILKDRGLVGTSVGQLSLSAAAVVDAFAWVLLSLVVALAGNRAGASSFLMTVSCAVLVVGTVLLVLKPAYAWLLRERAPQGEPDGVAMTALMIGLLVCALATELIHLHAVFGAFLFGACLPRDDRLLSSLSQRIEPLCLAVLMPLFFALAGLGTTPGALVDGSLWFLSLILLVAVIGKMLGSAAGARLVGYGWRDSLATGALMNARGLMELVVTKVGLDARLIGPDLFTMLLVMALVTTAMAGPLLSMLAGRECVARTAVPIRHRKA